MQSIGNTYQYQRIYNQEDHYVETRIDIGSYSYDDDDIVSLITRRHAFGTKAPELGSAISGEIELSMYGISASIPRNAEMRIWVRLSSADGASKSDWLPKGAYFIDMRSKDSETIDGKELINITGYDAMMKAERIWENHTSYWVNGRETDKRIVQLAASYYLNVPVDNRTLQIISEGFTLPLPTQYSVRETLGIIAALYGGSFIIDDRGYLKLICIWDQPSGDSIGEATHELIISPPYPSCTGVRMVLEEEGYKTDEGERVDAYISGNVNSGYAFNITCPFATQLQANWLYGQMRNLVYKPFQANTAELNPAAEIGDLIEVKGVQYAYYSEEITFGKYYTADFGAPGEEEVDHEYQFKTSTDRQYSRRLYNAEATLSIHETDIEARVTIDSPDGGTGTFGWSLQSDHWDVYSGNRDNVVLHVDANGLQVKGNGEFSGTIHASSGEFTGEVHATSGDFTGTVNATSGTFHGIIEAESFRTAAGQVLATTDQLEQIRTFGAGAFDISGSGFVNALNAANRLNLAAVRDSNDPIDVLTVNNLGAREVVTAGDHIYSYDVRAANFNVLVDSSSGDSTSTYNIEDHTHDFTESNGEIHIEKADWTGADHYFRIASTNAYQAGVEARFPKAASYKTSTMGGTNVVDWSTVQIEPENQHPDDDLDKGPWELELLYNGQSGYDNGKDSVTVTARASSDGTVSIKNDRRYVTAFAYATANNGKSDSDDVEIDVQGVYVAGQTYGENLHANDYSNGYDAGYSAGETNGYNSGYDAGYSRGYSDGYSSGWWDGYDHALGF